MKAIPADIPADSDRISLNDADSLLRFSEELGYLGVTTMVLTDGHTNDDTGLLLDSDPAPSPALPAGSGTGRQEPFLVTTQVHYSCGDWADDYLVDILPSRSLTSLVINDGGNSDTPNINNFTDNSLTPNQSPHCCPSKLTHDCGKVTDSLFAGGESGEVTGLPDHTNKAPDHFAATSLAANGHNPGMVRLCVDCGGVTDSLFAGGESGEVTGLPDHTNKAPDHFAATGLAVNDHNPEMMQLCEVGVVTEPLIDADADDPTDMTVTSGNGLTDLTVTDADGLTDTMLTDADDTTDADADDPTNMTVA
ncbi:hypothetical protein, partial [Litorimonas sp.]|uniref:hypothetical protein n=1 Tax=Litorimonas sp. TaxID=1892381 RepID=UPI003A88917A